MKTLLFLLTIPAFAQFEQGSIVGSVVDPQKAPIANAKVQIRSTTTNVSREVTTGQSGEYNDPAPHGLEQHARWQDGGQPHQRSAPRPGQPDHQERPERRDQHHPG